jgi:hypothetical protein
VGISESGEIEGDTNPPIEPETKQEISWLQQGGYFFKGAWDAGKETVQGLGSMAKGAWNLTGGWIFNHSAAEQTWSNLKATGSAIYNDPMVIWDAVKEPYVTAWSEGRYGKAIGRGAFEVVTAVVGTKGLDKLAKGSKVAGMADDVIKLTDKVDEIAKTGDKLGDTGKIAGKLEKESTKQASKKATENAGKEGVEQTGIRVTEQPKIAIDDKRKKHIFRKAEGHLEDTPSNRKMLEDVANNSENALGTDKWGNTWSAKVQPDGSQVWTQSRGGQIINGGVNQTPRSFNLETGLSSPIKPGGK